MKLYNFIRKFIIDHHLLLFGFIIFSIFVYFKFIRERLPKDLPFSLSVLGFFILVELCCIYVYIVYTSIRPSQPPKEVVALIVDNLFKPLYALDNYIKILPIIKIYHSKIFIWIAQKGVYIFQKPIFEICFFVLPRLILIVVFTRDIFFYSKLEYFYYVLVPMGLLLFIYRYFIYSIKTLKVDLFNTFNIYVEGINTTYEYGVHPSEWPENYDPENEDDDIPPTMDLDLGIFVHYYCKKILNNFEKPKINLLMKTMPFYNKYNTHDDNEYKVYKEQDILLRIALQHILELFMLHEYILQVNNHHYLKRYKIIVYSLYLICWVYILLISFHTLNIMELFIVMNLTWVEVLDPFSNIQIITLEETSYLQTLLRNIIQK
jgi:hypothetical protein